jgi:hypothetical protein
MLSFAKLTKVWLDCLLKYFNFVKNKKYASDGQNTNCYWYPFDFGWFGNLFLRQQITLVWQFTRRYKNTERELCFLCTHHLNDIAKYFYFRCDLGAFKD